MKAQCTVLWSLVSLQLRLNLLDYRLTRMPSRAVVIANMRL